MDLSFTERGARKLIRNGYQYVKQKDVANGLISWECIERRKGNCKAKVKLNAIDDFLEQVQEHTHALSATELADLTPTAAVNLPNLSNLRRNIRRQRCQCYLMSVKLLEQVKDFYFLIVV